MPVSKDQARAVMVHDRDGRWAGTRALTDKQRAFVQAVVVSGLGPTAAARAAGYVEAGPSGYDLIRHPGVAAAIHLAQRQRLGGLVHASISLLEAVVTGALEASVKVRVDAAKTILDRAGHGVPKAADPAAETDKPLQTMSVSEMEEFIRRGEEAIKLARQEIVTVPVADVTDRQDVDIVD